MPLYPSVRFSSLFRAQGPMADNKHCYRPGEKLEKVLGAIQQFRAQYPQFFIGYDLAPPDNRDVFVSTGQGPHQEDPAVEACLTRLQLRKVQKQENGGGVQTQPFQNLLTALPGFKDLPNDLTHAVRGKQEALIFFRQPNPPEPPILYDPEREALRRRHALERGTTTDPWEKFLKLTDIATQDAAELMCGPGTLKKGTRGGKRVNRSPKRES